MQISIEKPEAFDQPPITSTYGPLVMHRINPLPLSM